MSFSTVYKMFTVVQRFRLPYVLALPVVFTATMSTAFAQDVVLPAVPTLQNPSFLAQTAGRAAVGDGVYAVTTAPKLSVSAKWEALTQDERKRVTRRTGSESLLLDANHDRVALVTTTDATKNAPSVVTRFVSNYNTLFVARYAPTLPNVKPKPNEKPAPERTYFTIPLEGDISTATEALILAKANEAPLTRVTRNALLSPLDNGGYGWRGRGIFAQNTDGTITEILPVDANDRRIITTTRRYRFDARTRLPLAIEEWISNENKERKATRIAYRKESFTYSAFPTRTDLFVTKPAPNYAETSPPSDARLPDPPGPDEADTKARALLSRWERAWARFGSYNARVTVSAQVLPQTPESRPIPPQDATREGAFTLYYRRPGMLYAAVEPNPIADKDKRGMNRRRTTLITLQTAISDGKTLAVYEGANRETKRGDGPINGDDTILRQTLRRLGFDDRAESLTWLFDGPQSVFGNAEFAEYRGALPLPGGQATAEAVTIRQTIIQNGGGNGGARRRQRGNRRGGTNVVQTVVYTTVYFDKTTGLPLRLERYIATDYQAALQRDAPPNQYFSADYSLVRINEESSPAIFAIPD